jgi:hypothetical protein
MPDPDDFDQQLRDLTSGQAEPAKFTELSAAERIRRLPPPPAPQRGNWRKARKARQLRRPIGETGRKQAGDRRARSPKGFSEARQPQRNSASQRRHRLLTIAKTAGIVVAFAALLYGLHLLGMGPQ